MNVCIIGAGPSGITAAKNCLQANIDFTVFEKNDQVGGNWVFNAKTGHSSVYNNTHIISSKSLSQYEDYPMPDDYPDYPNHRQMQAYFSSYAEHFGILPFIQFETEVISVDYTDEQLWRVTIQRLSGEKEQHDFTHLMVANGHHWHAKHPQLPGEFSGEYMHSHDFKGVDDNWREKNVLVIGAGNSACDVAVESARVAKKVCLSMRSPQWFIPKFIFGQPSDVLASRSKWLPKKLRQLSFTVLLRLLQGRYRQYGLPEPQNPVLTQHPTANSDLLDFIRHGRIHPRKAIKTIQGKQIEFDDGVNENIDIIVACTGFSIKFPFFDKQLINFENATRIPLFKKMMHASIPNIYFIGLFQPLGCIWPLADHQAKLAVQEMLGHYQRPTDMQDAIQYELDHPHYDFQESERHSTEVDYHQFRKELKEELLRTGLNIDGATSSTLRSAG